jgi:Na+-transporting NADH:ubiquinone oxidoreductase subunit C
MPENGNSAGWLASLPNDSVAKTLIMAVGICLICSVAVSVTAVQLKPLQVRNAELARQTQILRVAGLWRDDASFDEMFARIDTRMVDLASGEFTDAVEAETFDTRRAVNDPEFSIRLSSAQDVAGIGRRVKYMPVYLVEEDGALATLILPVRARGLYSMLYGFLALEGDGNTVKGITFYEDGETPGLGGEINNPRWQARWVGREVFDDTGRVRLEVVRGAGAADSPEGRFEVDALSGATLTSRGVNNLIQFWMGEDGYGPFLDRVRKGQISI